MPIRTHIHHINYSSRLLAPFVFVGTETQTDKLRMSYGECRRDLSLLLHLMTLPFFPYFFLALEKHKHLNVVWD